MPHETHPVFVDQTKKYAHTVGERDYVTTENPYDHPLFKGFIDDKTYQEILSGVAVHCVDMLFYNPQNESFLIGTRQQEPHSGDWVIGGRMRGGESIADAAARNTKRELGIDIDRSKLRPAGHYNIVWDTREQPPTAVLDNEHTPRRIIGHATGAHNTSTLEIYPLSPEELEEISHNEEYSILRWVRPDEVLGAPEGAYHPCLVDMFADGLEAVTIPDPATTVDEARLRLHGQIAVAQAKLRQLG